MICDTQLLVTFGTEVNCETDVSHILCLLVCVSKQMRTEIIGNIIIFFPCMSLVFNFSFELEHAKEQ